MRNISYYLARKWHKSALKAQFLYRSLSKTSFTHRMPPCSICPQPDILCENLGFQASILQGQLRVFVFAVRFCLCCEAFAFAVRYLLLPWSICFCREVFAFAVKYLLLSWGICFCREVFAFAVKYLLLPWGICFCREVFAFAVRVLVLPWQFWAESPKLFKNVQYIPKIFIGWRIFLTPLNFCRQGKECCL